MLNRIRKYLDVGRYLSLDVVIGGMVFSKAIADTYQVTLPASVSLALGASIWLIYTLDHLIDARNVVHTASTKRHVFHQVNGKRVFIVFVLIAFLGLWTLMYLPYAVLIYGCLLLGLVGLYFLTIWFFKIFFAKEIFIAVLYTCGVFLGTVALIDQIGYSFYVLSFQSVLLASINLLLFSLLEIQKDKQDGHNSWVIYFGLERSVKHIKILFMVFVLCQVVGIVLFSSIQSLLFIQLIFSTMGVVLWAIFQFSKWFEVNERYRWAGDLVFLFPGFILVL